jgi:myo-inositol-1-phosphate synthase
MTNTNTAPVAGPAGRLGVLIPGMGAVATTLIAGVEAVRRGLALPVGSLTQMGELDRRPVRAVVPLAQLDDLVFGGWDLHGENAYQTARRSRVLDSGLLEQLRDPLERIEPFPAVFDQAYVRRLQPAVAKPARTKYEAAEMIAEDIQRFQRTAEVARLVMIWCGSTEVHQKPSAVHATLRDFECGLKTNHAAIAPSMIYAYAALQAGVPFINGAPNLTTDTPALLELARERHVPLAGKDFKTGQTMVKTVLAPMLRTRALGLNGWFSTNILGNRDGEVLDDPASFKTKEETKLSVLDQILEPDRQPQLYGNISHQVRINYYPPVGDNKEGWDNIDLFGWLGYPMQIKVNFLCRDSILAAPLALDLVLLADLAKRAGLGGVQEWLGFYFKSPMTANGASPEHDLFRQRQRLDEALLRVGSRFQVPGSKFATA